jgi:hypothetical protein
LLCGNCNYLLFPSEKLLVTAASQEIMPLLEAFEKLSVLNLEIAVCEPFLIVMILPDLLHFM